MAAKETQHLKKQHDDTVFLVGKCQKELRGSKLPSMQQVLQLYFYQTRVEKLPAKISTKRAVSAAIDFWKKVEIPTMTMISCENKLQKLYQEWRLLQRKEHCPQEKHREKEKKFQEKIENFLFDIAAPNAVKIIKRQATKTFLLMQRKKGRPGNMPALDVTSAQGQTSNKI